MKLHIPSGHGSKALTVIPAAPIVVTAPVVSLASFYDITPQKWDHSSPSQIKTFRRCNLRWWFNKIAGLGETSGEAAERGTKIHKVLEDYLKGINTPLPDAEWHTAARIAAQGVHRIPKPGVVPHEFIEVAGNKDTPIVPLSYRIDYIWTQLKLWACNDHKSIKNLKYKLDETELRMDPQAIIYSKALLETTGDPEVGFRHIYYQTGAPGSDETSLVMGRGEVDDLWGTVVYTVEAQKKYSTATDSRQVPGNDKACKDYGKLCDFAAFCPVRMQGGGFFSFGAPKKADPMGLIDVLSDEAKKKAQETLILAGHPKEAVMAMPAITLAALVHQLKDPVNPPDQTKDPLPPEDDGEEGDDEADEKEEVKEPTPGPGSVPPEKLHWKAASQQLAELSKMTFQEVRDGAKQLGWKSEDIHAELRRLRNGEASSMKVALAASIGKVEVPKAAPELPKMVPAVKVEVMKVTPADKPLMTTQVTVKGQPDKVTLDIYRTPEGVEIRYLGKVDVFPVGTTIAAAVEKVRAGEPEPVVAASVTVLASPRDTVQELAEDQARDGRFGRVTTQAPVLGPGIHPEVALNVPTQPQTAIEKVVTGKAEEPTPQPPTTPVTVDPIILYLDCNPSWEHSRLEDLVTPIQAEIENDKRAWYFGILAFNEGPKLVAAKLAERVATGKLKLPEHLVIRTFQACAWPCYDVLVRYAKGVVRAGG